VREHLKFAAVVVLLVACQATDVQSPATERSAAWKRELARLSAELDGLPSDMDRTTFLRRYTGELIDIGRSDGRTLERYRSLDFESFDPAEFFPLFESDSLPAACGITSFFYIKLLQAFDYKAYQYSFGFTAEPYDRFIHSVALVEIEFGGARRLVIQDPYLNLTYRTPAGDPIDFFDFLTALEARRFERIVMDASSSTTSLLVPEPAIYERHLTDECKALLAEALRGEDGSVRTRIPIARDYDTLMRSPCDPFESAFEQALRRNGFEEPLLYAYTLRASDLVGAPDHPELQRRIDEIVR